MYKQMFIMCGPSGCGKSTLAKKIKDKMDKRLFICKIFSTDDFFVDRYGEYKFEPNKLGYYHEMNRLNVEFHANHCDIIIVDNTNLTRKEREPYIKIAKTYGFHVTVLTPQTSWFNDVDGLLSHTTHGVPKQSIERMLKKYEPFNYLEEVLYI